MEYREASIPVPTPQYSKSLVVKWTLQRNWVPESTSHTMRTASSSAPNNSAGGPWNPHAESDRQSFATIKPLTANC